MLVGDAQVGLDRGDEVGDAGNAPRLRFMSVSSRKKRSTRLSQLDEGRIPANVATPRALEDVMGSKKDSKGTRGAAPLGGQRTEFLRLISIGGAFPRHGASRARKVGEVRDN